MLGGNNNAGDYSLLTSCPEHGTPDFGLPCAWPGCAKGSEQERVRATGLFARAEVFHRRQSFSLFDGSKVHFWAEEDQPTVMNVSKMLKREIAKLAPLGSDPVYHYTTISAFKSIVEERELWLTDYAYLNDSSEVQHGIELAKPIFESAAAGQDEMEISKALRGLHPSDTRVLPRVFVACFSSRDSLSQWRSYSRGTLGVAIGFRPWNLDTAFGSLGNLSVARVLYSDSDKKKILQVFASFLAQAISIDRGGPWAAKMNLADFYSGALRGVLFELAAHYKDAAFQDEREVRMIVKEESREGLARALMGRQPIKKRFRTSDGGLLVPYVSTQDLRLTRGYSFPFAIDEVMIAPNSRNDDLPIRGVKEFLKEAGLPQVPVRPSAIPFR